MAFKKRIVLNRIDDNLVFTEAYIKIVDITGNKDLVKYKLATYASQESCNAGKDCLDTPEEYSFVPDESENSLRWDKQAYLHAKSLPQYADALDC